VKISKKLFLALLGLGILVLFASTASSLLQLAQVKSDLDHNQQQQAAELTRLNTELMENTNAQMLTALAGNYSDTIESKFEAITTPVNTIKTTLEKAYTLSQPSVSGFPDDMVYLQPGVNASSVNEEFQIVKSVRDMIDAAMKADTTISMYYVTESGMLLAERYADYSGGSSIDRRTRPWYLGAAESGDIFWTPIYTDALSGEMTITCSAPVYHNDLLMGVIASDIMLDPLIDSILTSDTELFEYIFLTDKDGNPFVGSIPDKTLTDFIPPGMEQELITTMLNPEYSTGIFERDEVMIGYSTIPATGWRLGIVLDYNQITAPQQEITGAIAASNHQFQEYLNQKILTAVLLSGTVALLVIILVLLMSRQISRSITRPLAHLTHSVEEISSGNLDQHIDLHSGDELEVLANAFNNMSHDLKDYINNLATVTAERERIATELNLATRIQSSMLPSIFPAFPDRSDIDIYAAMIPAKEVGGDFYDFFMIDDQHLGMVIADVSGKGIPAALFMVITKTLLKNAAQQGLPVNQILETVNNQLVQNNEENMFVTVFISILDIPTGTLKYSSAGHNPPYVLKSNGTPELLNVSPRLMLAAYPDITYDQHQTTLSIGDSLILYTDGVTEAMNQKGDLFGEPRLETALKTSTPGSARQTLDTIFTAVRTFESGTTPTDDLTLLILKRII